MLTSSLFSDDRLTHLHARAHGAHYPICRTSHLPTRPLLLSQARPLRGVLRGSCILVSEYFIAGLLRVIQVDNNCDGKETEPLWRALLSRGGCPNFPHPGCVSWKQSVCFSRGLGGGRQRECSGTFGSRAARGFRSPLRWRRAWRRALARRIAEREATVL